MKPCTVDAFLLKQLFTPSLSLSTPRLLLPCKYLFSAGVSKWPCEKLEVEAIEGFRILTRNVTATPTCLHFVHQAKAELAVLQQDPGAVYRRGVHCANRHRLLPLPQRNNGRWCKLFWALGGFRQSWSARSCPEVEAKDASKHSQRAQRDGRQAKVNQVSRLTETRCRGEVGPQEEII